MGSMASPVNFKLHDEMFNMSPIGTMMKTINLKILSKKQIVTVIKCLSVNTMWKKEKKGVRLEKRIKSLKKRVYTVKTTGEIKEYAAPVRSKKDADGKRIPWKCDDCERSFSHYNK